MEFKCPTGDDDNNNSLSGLARALPVSSKISWNNFFNFWDHSMTMGHTVLRRCSIVKDIFGFYQFSLDDGWLN